MEPFRQYLSETEHATMALFENLQFYLDLLAEIEHPIFVSSSADKEKREQEYDLWIKQNRNKILTAIEKGGKYFGYNISKSTICGSIIQIAFMAILHFSTNHNVPDYLANVVKKGSKPAKFCIGRKIRETEIGLIVYAGRNQYNHMDEKSYNKITTNIFTRLASHGYDGNIIDPAFDLNNSKITIYSSNIIALLGWSCYENYITDMFDLLKDQ